MPNRFLLLTLFIGLGADVSASCPPAELLLVRHAEKRLDTETKDPELSQAGRQRSAALAKQLADSPLDAVYTTPYRRTQETVATLSQTHQLTPKLYDPKAPETLVKELNTHHCKQHVLVVGHSNTLPDLLTRLGVAETITIADTQYGDLFHLRFEQGRTILVRDHFGD